MTPEVEKGENSRGVRANRRAESVRGRGRFEERHE